MATCTLRRPPVGPASRRRRKSAAAGGVTTCVRHAIRRAASGDRCRDPAPTRSAGWSAPRMSTWRCTARSPRPAASTRFLSWRRAASRRSSCPPMNTTRCASRASTIRRCSPRSARSRRPACRCAIHNEDQELVEMLTAQARAAGRTDADHALPHPAAAGRDDGRSRDLRDGAGDRRARAHRAFLARARLRARRDVPRHGRGDHAARPASSISA